MQIILTFSFCIVIIAPIESLGQVDICEKVKEHITESNELIRQLPDYPNSETEAENILYRFRGQNPRVVKQLIALIEEDEHNRKKYPDWSDCFITNSAMMDLNILGWRQFLSGKLIIHEFRSAEFVRGSGVHLDINQGVSDLGRGSEAYVFASRILYSYTFVRKSVPSGAGGRIRIMAGPSAYYYNSKFLFLGNVRLEHRLLDIGGKQFSIGNVKLLMDANSDLDIWIIGLGGGVEIYNLGFHLLYQRQNEVKRSHLLTGLFYRIQF